MTPLNLKKIFTYPIPYVCIINRNDVYFEEKLHKRSFECQKLAVLTEFASKQTLLRRALLLTLKAPHVLPNMWSSIRGGFK